MSDKYVKNPKRLLLDLAHELDGETIESTVTVKGYTWTMSLLTEDELNWRNSWVNTGSKLSLVSSLRLPTLAICIRRINDIPVYDFFSEEWEASEETRNIKALLDGKGRFSQKYFAAEHLMEFLAERKDPEILEELYVEYQKLEKRRVEAQAALKKSSGENSETAKTE